MSFSRSLRAAAGACLLASAAVLAAAPASAATMISGQVGAAAAINFLTEDANHHFTEVSDIHASHDDWTGGVAHDLSTTIHAAIGDGGDSGSAQSTVSAHWDSADKGSVQIGDRGWSLHTPDPAVSEAVAGVSDADTPDWSYTFSVAHSGTFDIDFDVRARGDTDGMGLWNFVLIDNSRPQQVFSVIDLNQDHGFNAFGVFNRPILGGHTYTVRLASGEIHFGLQMPAPDVTASESGTFNWSINTAAVPEPSTWAFSILGFGLAGAGLRRRRGVEKFA